MELSPGIFCEVIRDNPRYPDRLWAGRVVSLREVFPGDPLIDGKCLLCGAFCDGVTINEVSDPTPIKGFRRTVWGACQLRPIYRPQADAFTHLLTDIPSDLETV